MDYRIGCEEMVSTAWVDVTPSQLPCASYLFDNFWEGTDGTIYRVVD